MQKKRREKAINNHVLWRIYDITYDSDRKDLPTEIIVDLDKFYWAKDVEVGMMNLNFKVFKAIEQITNCKSTGAKAEVYKKIC